MHHQVSSPQRCSSEPGRDDSHSLAMLALSEVTKWRGGRCVLDQVTFRGREGECIVVCGPSGSGKTTLLRAIAGLDSIDHGTVHVGRHLKNNPSGAVLGRGEVGMVFQGEQLYTHLTLLDNITLGPSKVLKQPAREAARRATELLTAVGLADKVDRYPRELSGGERQRGAIVRALAMSPKLMLFDEPTSALDPSCIKEVLALIHQLRDQGQTMILVTHETAFARMIADRIICMDAGRISEVGVPHKMIVAPQHHVTRQLFGDALQGISALDRVIFTGELTVGCFDDDDPRVLPHLSLLTGLSGYLQCKIAVRLLTPANPALQLRMGVADVIVTARKVDTDDLRRLREMALQHDGCRYNAYLSETDTVWVRAVTRDSLRGNLAYETGIQG